MSTYNQFISDEEATPLIKNDLFAMNSDNRFATVVFGVGNPPIGVDKVLFNGYLSLRKNVYVDQTGILDPSDKFATGIESDEDDKRCLHIAVFENRGGSNVAVVGCVRLIIKRNNELLPVETFYPEIFSLEPVQNGSVEISRFISRAKKGKGDNYKIIMSLFRAMLGFANENNVNTAYGIIETRLEKAMRLFSKSFKRIADIKMIEEYNTENVGIKVDVDVVKKEFANKKIEIKNLDLNEPLFWGEYGK